jgi:hypothetical protein
MGDRGGALGNPLHGQALLHAASRRWLCGLAASVRWEVGLGSPLTCRLHGYQIDRDSTRVGATVKGNSASDEHDISDF